VEKIKPDDFLVWIEEIRWGEDGAASISGKKKKT